MSEHEEYTPDDEDVEETYVAYEYRFSAETDPRGNYLRWLAAHDRALREQIARDILDVAGDWDTILDAFAENTTWETTGTEMTRRIITAMAAIARGEGSE